MPKEPFAERLFCDNLSNPEGVRGQTQCHKAIVPITYNSHFTPLLEVPFERNCSKQNLEHLFIKMRALKMDYPMFF
jgi:hypothetical protein